jgi:hypothetical protein
MSAPKSFDDPLNTSTEYKTLINEIKATIIKTDNLFKDIQETTHPDVGTYSSSLSNYKLNISPNTTTDEARQKIWDFINKKYEENTKLRTYFFNELRKVEDQISILEKEKDEFKKSIKNKNTQYSTSHRTVNQNKYEISKLQYYQFMYKVLLFIQILIIFILTLFIFGLINKPISIVFSLLLLIGATGFVIYYVFFTNISRSKMDWNKVEHNSEGSLVSGSNGGNGGSSSSSSVNKFQLPDDEKRKAVDKSIEEIIAKGQ